MITVDTVNPPYRVRLSVVPLIRTNMRTTYIRPNVGQGAPLLVTQTDALRP